VKITVFCGPYPADEHMGGTGLRMWELAQVLAGDGAHVTVVVPRPSPFTWQGITITVFDEDTWPGLIAGADAIITTDLPDTRLLLHAYHCGVLTVVENAPPIEHLHYAELRSHPDPQALYDELVDRYRLQLLIADHLLVRSPAERASTLGALVAVGRLGWAHHRQSPALAHLITLLPVGFNRASAEHAAAASPGKPADLVWNGGIWDYCEPSPLWPALARLRDAGQPLTLRLLYPPPQQARDVIAAGISRNGLDTMVEIPDEPVPHRQRDGLLLAARAIACTGHDGAETQTCHRLRLRDAFLYQLPVVIDHYGASADLVTQHRIGAAVDPGDTAALARALAAATHGPARDGYLAALAEARDRFTFESAISRLQAFLAACQHAPDIGSRRHKEAIADLMARRPLLAETPTHLL
jgi:glycosyltransferase involved in cell wall biosynthesis